MGATAELNAQAASYEHGLGPFAPATSGEGRIPAVEVSQLRKTYAGGVEAVKGIDFEVAGGEVFGLLGPNGAGKSTTIGMLTTTIAPTGGTARLVGHDVAKDPLLARSVSSVVFQEAVVDRGLSGRANLDLHARLWGVGAAVAGRRIAELTQALGLSGLIDRPAGSYSGGERRRLEIARALVSQPRVYGRGRSSRIHALGGQLRWRRRRTRTTN